MYGYIYKTTNLIDGKIYIGQKKSTIFLFDKYLGSGKRLQNAINKYGKENFKVELLEEIYNVDQMDDREIYWIKYYHSTNKEIGYNISNGGNVNRSFSGKNHPMYGRKRSGKDNPAHGRKWWTNGTEQVYQKECPGVNWHLGMSDEMKKKLSESHKGREAWNKGLTKSIDNRLNGNYHKRSDDFKKKVSMATKGENNPMYGKYGNLKYKYVYENKEFLGKGELIKFLRENGYENFTSNNIPSIIAGKSLKKFQSLKGKIVRITLTEDEIKEIKAKWVNI